MIEILLEWLAFGGSLLSVWCYGKSPTKGPIIGMIVSIIFILYGVVSGIFAASISNIVFFILHYNNYKEGKKMDWDKIKKELTEGFRVVQKYSYECSANAGWWDDIKTEDELYKIVPTKLCLIHSEISEAMEGHRKNLPDDKLPHYPMIGVELADAVIRIGDLAGKLNLDLGKMIAEKMEYNSVRPDHKRENRSQTGGKKY